MQPLVSVVVPAYNHEQFVAAGLRSVRDQDYPAVELIIVDDASSDGTAEICRKFVAAPRTRARFTRVELVRHARNAGTHAALNDGIAAARGRYVAFLNSDDQYARTRLAACVAAAGGAERFVFSAVRTIDDAGRTVEPDLRIQVIRQMLSAGQRSVLPSLSFAFLAHQVAISTGNMFVARTLLDRSGPFAALRYCHDWDMAMRLIQLVEPLYVPEELYLYRYHASNSSKRLQDVAEHETEQVLRQYFRRIKLGRAENPLAPSPVTWPGVFEMFARSYGVHKWWQAESGAYPKGARVVAPGPDLMVMDP